MKEIIEQKYENLFDKYHFARPIDAFQVTHVIKNSLQEFMKLDKKTAIYCNGGHTKMLMADFMFELKNIKFIIDNYSEIYDVNGFYMIRDDEIEKNGIEAVIISSFKFRNSIIDNLKKNHPSILFLDIYDKLAENGIVLKTDYYYQNHPYQHYRTINSIQRKIREEKDECELIKSFWLLITQYIHIKDFLSAIVYAKELYKITSNLREAELISELENLYNEEISAVGQISEKNVLMFCLDGLRHQDFSNEYMPKMTEVFEKKGFIFDNAYSFSTSTFESLLPAYSENDDLRTGYYNKNFVEENDCRFLQEAIRQKRKICFYTDMNHFVKGENVHYSGTFQTVTEKLWNFILDAVDEENGLYYIHELYESHFTFSNPYTEEKLISEGTAMLFDFLPQKGGKLRTDYAQQHLDAIRYLDDVLAPFFQEIRCRVVLYSDHGNMILKKECELKEVPETKLICDEEWIRIVCAICSPEINFGRTRKLFSIMSLNDIIISLLKQEIYREPENDYIKVVRSELYNPNFQSLYKMLKKDTYLLAFEAFIFKEGYKLVVFSDGTVELYRVMNDKRICDNKLIDHMLEKVKKHITVYAYE